LSRVAVFLRGINVGGRAKLSMTDLRRSLDLAGFDDVETILQSGNILLTPGKAGASDLSSRITDLIAEEFDLDIPVIVRTRGQLKKVLTSNPFLDDEDDQSRAHAAFLQRRPTAANVESLDPDRSPPDRFLVDGDVVYLHYPHGSGRSKLTLDYLERTLGVIGTARNWNTIGKVAARLGV
jgi:uncharacterized protein (DUF1697 family)